MDYPFEIWFMIFGLCSFRTKIRLRQVCKLFYYNLHVSNFYDISKYYKKKLFKNERVSENIFKGHDKKKIYSLDATDSKIQNLNDFTNLKKLKIHGSECVIDDESI